MWEGDGADGVTHVIGTIAKSKVKFPRYKLESARPIHASTRHFTTVAIVDRRVQNDGGARF